MKKNIIAFLVVPMGLAIIFINSSFIYFKENRQSFFLSTFRNNGPDYKIDTNITRFFTNIEKVNDIKNFIKKAHGIKENLLSFSLLSIGTFAVSTSGTNNNVITYYYSHEGPTFKLLKKNNSKVDIGPRTKFSVNDISIDVITNIVKQVEVKIPCQYDSCIISRLTVEKHGDQSKKFIFYEPGITSYKAGRIENNEIINIGPDGVIISNQ